MKTDTTDNSLPVGESTRVFLNFSLTLADGGVVDSNFGGREVSFVIGDGSLLPAFERCLFGLFAGDSHQFTLTPEETFGMPNPVNVQELDRDDFDAEMDLVPGLVVSFADAAGGELPGVIASIDGDVVSVDFNHPLAGRSIIFDVEIHRIEAAELH
ncbi:MAG: FKBP-type peptidyl-prolyl cis-trans isomerase SlpA [Halieaceae bacterium]